MESYQTKKTKNGLKVIVVKRPKNPQLVYLQFMVGIGSDLESGRQLEIGHFLEHLFVSLTSKKHPDSKANRDLLSRNNITFTASIGTKNTIYEYSFRKTKLDLFLDIFINGILDYRVDKMIFGNEKNSIIEELHEIIDDLSYNLETYTDAMLYSGHRRVISQKVRLANTLKMTHGQIQNYWEKYYRIPYSVLVVYGALDIEVLVKKVDAIANQIKSTHKIGTPLNKLDLSGIYPENKKKSESKIMFSRKDDNIATIKLCWRINMNMFSRDYYKIFALDFILISDLNSLLLKKLRTEKGLIYDMESFFTIDEFQESLSFYTFETTVGSKKVLQVLNAFMEVIDYLTKNRIKEEHFKNYIETQNQLILYRNESMDFKHTLTTYARSYLWGKNILTQEAEDKLYVDINRDDIFRVARSVFKTNNLYISYSSSKNINTEIETLLDSQDF